MLSATHRKSSRSQLEVDIKLQLRERGIDAELAYESVALRYKKYHRALIKGAKLSAPPLRLDAVYHPDFKLPNGLLIETKGRFTVEDAEKHLLVKKQHPSLDIRFVFSDSSRAMEGEKNLSRGEWCVKHEFLYADGLIPPAWFE